MTQAPAYVSPQWVLIVGDGRFMELAEESVKEDFLDVHRTTEEEMFHLLVGMRLPALALVDLDTPLGPLVVRPLMAHGVMTVVISASAETLEPFVQLATTAMQKPFTPKGISKIVNFLLGRK